MVVRRILLSAALMCILPLPFSSLLTESAPLVLGAPPLHLLAPHAPSSSSSSASSSIHHPSLASNAHNKQAHASTTASTRRSLKKRTAAAVAAAAISIKFDPPAPPENVRKFKKCFHQCITGAQEHFPECKGDIPSHPPSEGERLEEDMTWHSLCPLASYVCLHTCKLHDMDWSQWMGAVDEAIVAQQQPVKSSTK
ncbi:MAG: hypothetical protein J3R72DRAFT_511792 [Linnemannia gamsii]|nr:MAG: hypothetical protein J3R72DRAFT_511792 [Linnemannia gamsii]